MQIINIHEAKTQLSKYLAEVEGGKEIIIGRYGQPIARLVPFVPVEPRIKLGLLKGKLNVPDNFDEPDEALAALFEGRFWRGTW